jgi:acetyl esterase/lipase
LLIQVGSTEILLDENRAFADRAGASGIDVTLDVWPGMFHFWQAHAPALPEGQEAIERAGAFIRRHVEAANL